MSAGTYWACEYLTNSSGRRASWNMSLQSIRRTRFQAMQAALDYFVSLDGATKRTTRWEEWHALRDAGKVRAVKLSITKATKGATP